MQGSSLRLLACEASSVTSRLFADVRYHAGIIRIATIAIFSRFEISRTRAKKFCRESKPGAVARYRALAEFRASGFLRHELIVSGTFDYGGRLLFSTPCPS